MQGSDSQTADGVRHGVRRLFLAPSWLLRHALVIFLVLLFARLGWWQWTKGESSHGTMQNLFYGLEWPVFSFFVIFLWWKMVKDEIHPPDPAAAEAAAAEEVARAAPGGVLRAGEATPTGEATLAAASVRVPDTPADLEEDAQLAAYNRYLASLYERDA